MVDRLAYRQLSMRKGNTRLFVATLLAALLTLIAAGTTNGADSADTASGDQMIAAYFRNETRALADACLADINSREDWTQRRETYRAQLREMLGLEPLPERTPLHATVTGKLDHAEFVVEKLHFQSRPGLFVTANLYLPKNVSAPAPAILYVCGHSQVKTNGISYGNKVGYQHHGAWFARNGYVCLVIDTLQLGEIEGIHHGTYRENMWWWNARGYTPAGVEAWNSIRALDYLESRPEVDATRIGVTGRSGGGAYSWYLAALDHRVKVAVPVAGITNLEDHVIHGCVEGHCDCMYFVNTYRWDYPQLAAMVAPRPLLISNTDRDSIFPLEGVIDVHERTRRLYRLHQKPADIALQIAAGSHDDLQVLQLHALQWFNHHLRGEDGPITTVAERYFEPEQLKVFDTLPTDAINAEAHETFVPQAVEPAVPQTLEEWHSRRNAWLESLRRKCFAGWPAKSTENATPPKARLVASKSSDSAKFSVYEFDSQHDIMLHLYLLSPAATPEKKPETVVVHPLDAASWLEFVAAVPSEFAEQLGAERQPTTEQSTRWEVLQAELSKGHGLAFVAPRGIGPTAWNADPRKQIQIRRRFMLLGQTLDGMRVWDVRRALQTLRALEGLSNVPLWLEADGEMAGIALYAALFEPYVARLDLRGLAPSHRHGPDFLNVLRILDVPQTVAMVADGSRVRIHDSESAWGFPRALEKLFRAGELEIVRSDAPAGE